MILSCLGGAGQPAKLSCIINDFRFSINFQELSVTSQVVPQANVVVT